ncbi:putative Zn-binding protein involved in type VI secretion [Pseudomonas sp. 3296]|uniref:PAAR domain-containing protein n=1 Tax=Pseudomonas sp. 3296 TaxID=2817753 RepID=UPI002860978D|nr:PAAR domain-containing protein [Pseudomonas sp. 3296]MDR6914791.1 putative Zn-binding protein involved in type VI secretion [Pseudomonas sp. 3296]
MSGKPAARKTDTVSCPRCGGTAIESGSPNVFFDGLPAARVTDCTTCGSILTMAAMSSVQINGQAALVTGSQGTHGDTITGGSSSIIIGNNFTPAPVSPVGPMLAHLVEPSS